MESLQQQLQAHATVLHETATLCAPLIDELAALLIRTFRAGGKLLLCGNGGSAADAQHVAGEFVNRFRFDRPALPAIALTTDTSVLTCIGNDSDFEFVFSRQVEALAQPGDVVVGISTSGRSKNVARALQAARSRQAVAVGFTGRSGGAILGPLCDHCLAIPTDDTPRIQEAHEFVWHVICGAVESAMFPR